MTPTKFDGGIIALIVLIIGIMLGVATSSVIWDMKMNAFQKEEWAASKEFQRRAAETLVINCLDHPEIFEELSLIRTKYDLGSAAVTDLAFEMLEKK